MLSFSELTEHLSDFVYINLKWQISGGMADEIVKCKEFSAKPHDIIDVLRVFKKPEENYVCAVLIQILR